MEVKTHNTNGEHCKASVARRMAEAARRARKFAIAGAFGLAVLAGASPKAYAQDPQPGPVQMQPSATQPAATTAARPGVEQLTAMVTALGGDTSSAQYPSNAATTEALSANFIKIYEVREIVLHPPAATDPNRPVYDAAMQRWQNQSAAMEVLDQALMASMHNLHQKVEAGDSIPLGAGASMEPRLARIDAGIGHGDADYYDLETEGVAVAELLRVIRGGQLDASPRTQDRPTGLQPLPLIEPLPYTWGSEFLLNGFGGRQFVALNAASTPTLNSLFGGADIASGAMNALASGYTTMLNSPGDLVAQQGAARELLNQLNRIPSDKEIWNASVHPHFAAAMNALQRGDLRTALSELSQETAFNAVYDQLANLHQITISQRAVARLTASAWFRFPERANINEFEAYRRGSILHSYDWDVLHYDFGLTYSNLLVSGSDQAYRIDRATNSAVPAGSPQRVDGDGHAIDIGGAITWGGSMFNYPTETTLTGRIGWYWWNMQTMADVGGRMESLEASGNGPYGMLNLNFDFVGYEARVPRLRLFPPARLGIGLSNLDPYIYFTGSYRWTESNRLRLETSITPRYLLFWGSRTGALDNTESLFFQHRIGADVRPLDFTIQQSPNWTWYFGPGAIYDYNTEQGIHTLEPYVHANFRYADGVALDARVGYYMEFGGQESFHVPNTVTGTLNLVLTPALWGSGHGSIRVTAQDGGAASR
jgi:hypothetical protein